jgi:hypothetical protein
LLSMLGPYWVLKLRYVTLLPLPLYPPADVSWTRWSSHRLSGPRGCPTCRVVAHIADETAILSEELQRCLISEAYKYYAYWTILHPLERIFNINYDDMMINCEGCGSCHCLLQQIVPIFAWKDQLSIVGALECCCWANLATFISLR